MDPVRLAVGALTGAVFGNLFGYMVYKLNHIQSASLLQWLTHPNLSGAGNGALWAILGAAAGVGLVYALGQPER